MYKYHYKNLKYSHENTGVNSQKSPPPFFNASGKLLTFVNNNRSTPKGRRRLGINIGIHLVVINGGFFTSTVLPPYAYTEGILSAIVFQTTINGRDHELVASFSINSTGSFKHGFISSNNKPLVRIRMEI